MRYLHLLLISPDMIQIDPHKLVNFDITLKVQTMANSAFAFAYKFPPETE